MGQVFHPYEPEQAYLLPPSPQEWLPEGHLAHFVSETVEALDLSELYERYEKREDGRGQLAYEPRMMLKVMVYGYAVGIFSSRKIAKGLEDLVALRYLAGGNQPSHRTIARFREENVERFAALFAQIVGVAGRAGLVKMGTVAVDGTKVKANASKHKAMSYGRMKKERNRLEREIDRILKAAGEIDRLEDEEFGPDFRGDELPEELARRETRVAKIREAMKELEQEQAERDEESKRGQGRVKKMKRPNGEPPENKQRNFTDPESQIMKTSSEGYEQSYNGQIVVDEKARMIVAAGVTNSPADNRQLVPMLDEAEGNTGKRAKRGLADAGYRSEANFEAMAEREIDAYVSLGKERATREQAEQGTGRLTRKMGRKLRTKRGRGLFKKRKGIVEPAVGWIKHAVGFRSFSMRGLKKVTGEWNLVCLVVNLRRMHTMALA